MSAPSNPNTYVNTSALTPRAAVNDSTTVATRMSGAVIARRSSARMTRTVSRMIGMMSMLSAAEARWTSSVIALAPPTRASASGTAWTASRTRSTVS
ncbi:hypothetical protein D3C74_344460 [compost metagenome]